MVELSTKSTPIYTKEDKKELLVDEILGGDTSSARNWCWLSTLNSIESSTLFSCSNLLSGVKLAAQKNSWAWLNDHLSGFSTVTVKSLVECQVFGQGTNNWMPQKVNFIGWRAVLGYIPSKDQLLKEYMNQFTRLWPLQCYSINIYHILVGYPFAKAIWERVLRWIKLGLSWGELVTEIFTKTASITGDKALFQATNSCNHIGLLGSFWFIWKAKNDKPFEIRGT